MKGPQRLDCCDPRRWLLVQMRHKQSCWKPEDPLLRDPSRCRRSLRGAKSLTDSLRTHRLAFHAPRHEAACPFLKPGLAQHLALAHPPCFSRRISRLLHVGESTVELSLLRRSFRQRFPAPTAYLLEMLSSYDQQWTLDQATGVSDGPRSKNRTCMNVIRGILSPLRLPVPPCEDKAGPEVHPDRPNRRICRLLQSSAKEQKAEKEVKKLHFPQWYNIHPFSKMVAYYHLLR